MTREKMNADSATQKTFQKRYAWPALTAWLVLSLFSYTVTDQESEEVFDADIAQIAHIRLSQYLAQGQNDKATEQSLASFIYNKNSDGSEAMPVAFQIWNNERKLLERSANARISPLSQAINSFETIKLNGEDLRTHAIQDASGQFIVQVAQTLLLKRGFWAETLTFLLYLLLVAYFYRSGALKKPR